MRDSKTIIGTILSASCMTDMPAFYPQQLIEAVETRRKKGVPIHTLVLWTKHPASMLKEPLHSYLMGLRHNGIQLYIQLTITGMGQLPMGTDLNGNPILVEPHAPKWEDAVAVLPDVIELVGSPLRIRLRIDPILRFKDAAGEIQGNMEYVPKIIEATAPLGIKTYNFSFVEDKNDKVLAKGHVKVNRRFEKLGATILPPTLEERAGIKAWMEELSSQNSIQIFSCATPGMEKSSCINGAWLEQLHDSHKPTSHKECPSRALCSCTEFIDLGGWPPKKCYTGCLYCYSNPHREVGGLHLPTSSSTKLSIKTSTMKNEENNFGGTLGEGETSKRIEDQSIVAGQTNSNDAAMGRGEWIAQKIHEMAQSSVNVESQDKAICRVVNSWANKPTKEAEKFLKKGYTKYRYIGRKLSQAAVPFDTGLDYLKSKYPDEDPKHLEEEYTWGYGEVDYDEKFRKYITKS